MQRLVCLALPAARRTPKLLKRIVRYAFGILLTFLALGNGMGILACAGKDTYPALLFAGAGVLAVLCAGICFCPPKLRPCSEMPKAA